MTLMGPWSSMLSVALLIFCRVVVALFSKAGSLMILPRLPFPSLSLTVFLEAESWLGSSHRKGSDLLELAQGALTLL